MNAKLILMATTIDVDPDVGLMLIGGLAAVGCQCLVIDALNAGARLWLRYEQMAKLGGVERADRNNRSLQWRLGTVIFRLGSEGARGPNLHAALVCDPSDLAIDDAVRSAVCLPLPIGGL